MSALQKHHIVDLFVWVDNTLPKRLPTSAGGRPAALKDSGLLTILIWDGLNEPHQTLKDTYRWIARDYDDCFTLPTYKSFILHVHGLMPAMVCGYFKHYYDMMPRFGLPTVLCYRSVRTSEPTVIR